MRISIEKDDPGYSPFAVGAVLKVYLNDQEVAHCLTADDKTGYVKAYVIDPKTLQPMLNEACDGLVTSEQHGVVTIVLRPGVAPLMLTGVQ